MILSGRSIKRLCEDFPDGVLRQAGNPVPTKTTENQLGEMSTEDSNPASTHRGTTDNLWKIKIDPFSAEQVNPNSYNLRLGTHIAWYENSQILDMKKPTGLVSYRIPDEGFVMVPNKLYLAETFEYTESHGLVPIIEGRSSVGRLGINIHATAGFGDVGFCGRWTLEMSCQEPVRIYAGVEICQIYFLTLIGDYDNYGGSGSKYQGQGGIVGSRLYKDFI